MKEKGIHDRLLHRMRKDLESLAARVDGGKLKVGSKIERRVLDVLSGIELATITLRAGDGRKIALERISSPRPEEAQVLDTLGVRLPRKPRADKPPDLQLSLIDSGDQFSP